MIWIYGSIDDKDLCYACKDITSVFDIFRKMGGKVIVGNMAPAAFIQAMSFLGFWATVYAAPVSIDKERLTISLPN